MTIKNNEAESTSVDMSVSWDEVTNKPTRFAPIEHVHDVSWGEVIGKPTEFTPEYHTHDEYAKRYHKHTIEDIIGIEGLSINIGGGGGTSGDHNHDDRYYRKSQVDVKLSLKADVDHTHDISDLTGLEEFLDCYKQYNVARNSYILDEDGFYIYKVAHNLNTKALDIKVQDAQNNLLLTDVTIKNDKEIEILTYVEEDLVVLIKKINLIENKWRK